MADRRPHSASLGPLAACVFAALLFGATTPLAKPLIEGLGSLALSGLLYLGAALAVAPVARQERIRRGPRIPESASPRNRLRLLGAIVAGGMVGPVLLLEGLARASATSVSLWLTLESVLTALLGWLFFREFLGRAGLASVVLVVAASLLLAVRPTSDAGDPVAVLFVAGACLAWGLDNQWTALLDDRGTAEITLWKGLATGAVLLPLGLATRSASGPIEGVSIAAALGIGAVGYGLSLVLYVGGAQQLGATRSQLAFSTAPLFGVFASVLWLGEAFTTTHALALVLMSIAVPLLAADTHDHTHTHEPTLHTHWHRHDDGHHDHHAPGDAEGGRWHQHEHTHERVVHTHPHGSDLHHRHEHD